MVLVTLSVFGLEKSFLVQNGIEFNFQCNSIVFTTRRRAILVVVGGGSKMGKNLISSLMVEFSPRDDEQFSWWGGGEENGIEFNFQSDGRVFTMRR